MHSIRSIDIPKTDMLSNMAIDEALFLSAGTQDHTSTLRLYQSRDVSISLGYFQNIDSIDLDYLNENNIDHVRRITGGRAVMHGDDLTFSFLGNKHSPFFDISISKLTRRFSEIVIKALSKIDVQADISENSNLKRATKNNDPYCFSSFNKNELLVDGKKIAGYALKKGRNSFLLQGSIPLKIDHEVFSNIFLANIFRDNTVSFDKAGFTCINDCAKERVDLHGLKEVFIDAFIEEGFDITHDTLTEKEDEDYLTLLEEKYKSKVWNATPKEFLHQDTRVA